GGRAGLRADCRRAAAGGSAWAVHPRRDLRPDLAGEREPSRSGAHERRGVRGLVLHGLPLFDRLPAQPRPAAGADERRTRRHPGDSRRARALALGAGGARGRGPCRRRRRRDRGDDGHGARAPAGSGAAGGDRRLAGPSGDVLSRRGGAAGRARRSFRRCARTRRREVAGERRARRDRSLDAGPAAVRRPARHRGGRAGERRAGRASSGALPGRDPEEGYRLMILRLVLASLRRRFRQLALILAAVTVAAATVATLAGFSSRAEKRLDEGLSAFGANLTVRPQVGGPAVIPAGAVARIEAIPGVVSAHGGRERIEVRADSNRLAEVARGIESTVEGI